LRSGGLIDPDLAAELLESRAPEVFAERLLEAAYSSAGVEELFAYRVPEGSAAPVPLASSSGLQDAAERTEAYARRFHRSDPAVAARLATEPGSGFLARVPAAAIALGDYRKLCFERPRFVEKICFGWRKPDHSLVVTFYQRHDGAEPDLAQLGALAQIAITGLTRLAAKPADGAPLVEEVERRLAEVHAVLTAREREVCARTLAGRTAREIGAELGLGLGTVLTYRQRAYQKLGVSKSNDLLAAVMS
jgi:DNA-binding CsgD family transcriptional regulator